MTHWVTFACSKANNNTLVSLFHQGGNWSRDTLAEVSDDEAILDLEAGIKAEMHKARPVGKP